MGQLTDAASISGPAPVALGDDPACIEFTSGAAGSALEALPSTPGPYRSVVVLNGVGNTFALTMPNPKVDGQECAILFVTAISTAFSCTLKGAAQVIKGVPATASANTGIGFYYRAADATWYRKY